VRDRLRSVKASRNLRNVFLALSLAFVLEFLYLLYYSLLRGQPFVLSSLIFLLLVVFTSYLAYHYHVRFRKRD